MWLGIVFLATGSLLVGAPWLAPSVAEIVAGLGSGNSPRRLHVSETLTREEVATGLEQRMELAEQRRGQRSMRAARAIGGNAGRAVNKRVVPRQPPAPPHGERLYLPDNWQSAH